MSTTTVPAASRLQQSRGSGENKRAMSGKTRNRTSHGQMENPILPHPGKTVSGGQPITTPRKPLSLIGNKSRELRSSSSSKTVTTHKVKTTGLRSQKPKKQNVSNKPVKATPTTVQPNPTVKPDELDEIPDIETVSRRMDEPDEFDIGRFVPPDYFHSVTTLLKQPLKLIPLWAASSSSSSRVSHDLPPELDVPFKQVPSVEESDVSYTRDDLGLPETLPELPELDIW